MPGLKDTAWQQIIAAAAETDEQAKRLLKIQQAMDGVDAVAGSPDGSVRVSVDRNGAVTDLGLTEQAMRLGPAGLAAAVLAAIREAKRRIGPRYAEIVRSTGADEATVDRMVGRYRDSHPDRFLPEPVAPEPAAEQAPDQVMTKASAPPPVQPVTPPPVQPPQPQPPQPQPPQPQPPQRPIRARRPPVPDEDDDEQQPLMRRASNWSR